MGDVIKFPVREEEGEIVLTCGECEGQEFVVHAWGALCTECGNAIDWSDLHYAFYANDEGGSL